MFITIACDPEGDSAGVVEAVVPIDELLGVTKTADTFYALLWRDRHNPAPLRDEAEYDRLKALLLARRDVYQIRSATDYVEPVAPGS